MTGSELLSRAGLILRDGGGEIRLTLKPETLGSVRVRLRLADNAVEGRIIVDNPAVKQVFDAGLDALARALAAQGFDGASLQVSVSGGEVADRGGAQGNPEGPEGAAVPAADGRRSVERLAGAVTVLEAIGQGELVVNLLA